MIVFFYVYVVVVAYTTYERFFFAIETPVLSEIMGASSSVCVLMVISSLVFYRNALLYWLLIFFSVIKLIVDLHFGVFHGEININSYRLVKIIVYLILWCPSLIVGLRGFEPKSRG